MADIHVDPRCDAQLAGLPVGNCSDDLVEVWHGMGTPALSCGKHRRLLDAVFSGHRIRLGLTQPLTEKTIAQRSA